MQAPLSCRIPRGGCTQSEAARSAIGYLTIISGQTGPAALRCSSRARSSRPERRRRAPRACPSGSRMAADGRVDHEGRRRRELLFLSIADCHSFPFFSERSGVRPLRAGRRAAARRRKGNARLAAAQRKLGTRTPPRRSECTVRARNRTDLDQDHDRAAPLRASRALQQALEPWALTARSTGGRFGTAANRG